MRLILVLALSIVASAVAIDEATAANASASRTTVPQLVPRPPIPRLRIPVPRIRAPRIRLIVPPIVIPITRSRTTMLVSLRAARTWQAARRELLELYRRGDAYERLVEHGFCHAMVYVKDQSPSWRASQRAWRDYFNGYLAYWGKQTIIGIFQPRAVRVIGDWLNVWGMSHLSPQAAWLYYRACVGHR